VCLNLAKCTAIKYSLHYSTIDLCLLWETSDCGTSETIPIKPSIAHFTVVKTYASSATSTCHMDLWLFSMWAALNWSSTTSILNVLLAPAPCVDTSLAPWHVVCVFRHVNRSLIWMTSHWWPATTYIQRVGRLPTTVIVWPATATVHYPVARRRQTVRAKRSSLVTPVPNMSITRRRPRRSMRQPLVPPTFAVRPNRLR